MMIKQSSREFRYERKFLVDQLDAHQARAIVKIHPSMFYPPYPPRYVNNLYLDSEGMENYHDNVSGVGDRQKVRIRWYGDLFQKIEQPLLEVKVKRGLVGTKYQYPFESFSLDKYFCARYFHEVLQTSDLPVPIKVYMRDLNVVLLNRYYRWYYASRDGKFRITIDKDMEFYKVNILKNSFIHKQVDYDHIVVELKYQIEHEWQADKISGYFPFSVSKSSKYIMGIERVFA